MCIKRVLASENKADKEVAPISRYTDDGDILTSDYCVSRQEYEAMQKYAATMYHSVYLKQQLNHMTQNKR